MADRSFVMLDVRPGERVNVGDITVELVHKSGQAARLRVSAPLQIPIQREVVSEVRRAQPHAVHVPSTS